MQQNLTITYTKAVGIILMVLAHCSNFPLVDQIIHSFHMPLFFIVSGYCFKEKYLNEPLTFVQKRIVGLWWPYVKWGMLFLAMHNVFFRINIYNDKWGYYGIVQHLYTFGDFVDKAKSILIMTKTESLLGGYWFLGSLFWGSLIAFGVLVCSHLLSKKVNCNLLVTSVLGGGGGGLVLVCLVTNYIPKTFTVFLIGPREFMAATFFIVGYFLAKSKMPKFNWWQSILAFGFLVANSFWGQISAAAPFNDALKVVPYMITAVFGTWCVYSLPWHRMKGTLAPFMEYVGNHTLEILTWHLLCFKIISYILILVHGLPIEQLAEIPVVGESARTFKGWFVLYAIVGIGLPLLMTYLWENLKNKIVTFRHS